MAVERITVDGKPAYRNGSKVFTYKSGDSGSRASARKAAEGGGGRPANKVNPTKANNSQQQSRKKKA
jgi:hypothetical protein